MAYYNLRKMVSSLFWKPEVSKQDQSVKIQFDCSLSEGPKGEPLLTTSALMTVNIPLCDYASCQSLPLFSHCLLSVRTPLVPLCMRTPFAFWFPPIWFKKRSLTHSYLQRPIFHSQGLEIQTQYVWGDYAIKYR